MAVTVNNPTTPVAGNYNTVAASQTDQVLSKTSGGSTGATGDFLAALIISVATSATGTVSIKDGAGSAIPIAAANTPIGVYVVPLGLFSAAGGWKVTTGAGATVVATGTFS